MIGIGELRTWLSILRDAVQARVPAELVRAEGGADDKRLDAYLLRAAALSAAGYWIYGAIMQRVGAATAVAPLAREQSVAAPTTGYHDVRLVALARLALPDTRVIEVDWQQYGPKLAQVALTLVR